jgi:hypothetical protein
MSARDDYWMALAGDERQALLDGYGCGLCLDFATVYGIGPCPRCNPDGHTEHLIATAQAQLDTTWNEEHDAELGWEGAA